MNLNRTINQQIMDFETLQKQCKQYENDIAIMKNDLDIHVYIYIYIIYHIIIL